MDDLSDEAELHSLIEDVLSSCPLSTPTEAMAAGVAQQVLHKGLSSLSEKQLGLFNGVLGPFLRARQKELEAEHRSYLLSRDTPP